MSAKERKFRLLPEKFALLVLDMQDYFLREDSNAFVPSSPAIIENINSLIRLCEERQTPVFFTRHINTNGNARMMSNWWKRLINKNDKLSGISDLLYIPAGNRIVAKSQYDAFYNTNLDKELKTKNINGLIVCGVMTNLCVETTIRSAFVHGYETVLPLDATAAYTYDYHRATALNLAFGFSYTTLTDSILKIIGEND
jgi:isochorismate hydrolase